MTRLRRQLEVNPIIHQINVRSHLQGIEEIGGSFEVVMAFSYPSDSVSHPLYGTSMLSRIVFTMSSEVFSCASASYVRMIRCLRMSGAIDLMSSGIT